MCEYEGICQNRDKCYRCFNHQLLKYKGQKKAKHTTSQHDYRTAMEEDSWKDLEQQVADSLNNIPSIQEARRSRASGALPFEKGDIVDTILHPECKERTGRTLKAGEKSMSIQRSWLEKAARECATENTTMCLPFRFKGDSNIYCIFNHNDIAALITTMKAYIHDNEIKEAEIQRLNKLLEDIKRTKE